jgi:hypothetical protein
VADNNFIAKPFPLFSVIIAVYNDWTPLDRCLESLSRQAAGPHFEVIIVDDGSAQKAPASIERWGSFYPLAIVRESHAGVAAARNRGIQASKGLVLVFVDADCKVQPSCLSALAAAVSNFPDHHSFQLRLIGDRSRLVGRAEDLRLATLQKHLIQADGCIRYLNTAGFAIRRDLVNIERGLFNPAALRAEDTLLLANLVERKDLPFFVERAVVQHAISLPLAGCLLKDIRSGYLEGRTYAAIASRGVRIRTSHHDRLRMLRSMWKISGQHSSGKLGWLVLVLRQAVERISSIVCQHLPPASGSRLLQVS